MNLFCSEAGYAALNQNKNLGSIECKYCGCIDHPHVKEAKKPHAYRFDCAHCGKFYKWASKEAVEGYPVDLRAAAREQEDLAIKAARGANTAAMYKHLKKRDEYYERLCEVK